ncbi:ATP-binding cassette domain-containing protein [Sporosarcina sp. Te-1]|uniref:ATP-binding cassette domain-containing protein n=1 Tax=Sporosarcina sp. Te-1 TaxID=2818390 RepID=UPI001A9D331D|nr:ATP-binding cassette domain-containing protein [Sporosarcina sp. Te-1]QTD40280.1 ATP-binding cassette domain-containing protein [Sporosarcina sp. Te-1]
MVILSEVARLQQKPQTVHITIEQVKKRFDTKTVLQDISLEINTGQFVVIVGRSGSGKSTLLRLVAGLEKPTEGTIAFTDESIGQARMMYQDSRLLPWKSVIDNVGLGLRGNWIECAREALDQVGLLEFSQKWPSTLSGGQQQRVALARALVHKPSLLLLDEPMSALDALTRMEMQALIERLWKEQQFTALLVTHDVREAVKLGDRIILIEDGDITLDIDNPLRRPRDVANSELAKMEKKILDRILKG